ncbi:MAG: dihydropteroate synthase [Bacteroidales bacterium]|nr:dihydropteroate synthase [Bacteroidales bacterium]
MVKIESHKRTLESAQPLVMGIINLTPDSFFEGSRFSGQQVVDMAGKMLQDGATIIDLGAMSTRPGAEEISLQEELDRLIPPLDMVRTAFSEAFLSIDTYRSAVALLAYEHDADMINDISGGTFDMQMFDMMAETGLSYVLMHTSGRPHTMQLNPEYQDVIAIINVFFNMQIRRLHQLGVHNIVVDPGFGFGKTLAHNFQLLNGLHTFKEHGCPVMVGLSRKSMISKLLGINTSEALNGTSILNTIALLNAVDILRVHDVSEALQAVRLVAALGEHNPGKYGRHNEKTN